jgi:Glycosyltransferase
MNKVRILHIGLSERIYGTENVVMNLYRNVDRLRYQFDFLIHHKCSSFGFEEEIVKLGGRVYYQFYYIKEQNTEGYISPSFFFEMHPEIRGIHYHVNNYSLSRFRYVIEAYKRRIRIRIVHSHNSHMVNKIFRNYIHRLVVRLLVKKYSNKFIACSSKAGRWNFGKFDYEILPNGVDTNKFAFDIDMRKRIRKQYHLEDKLVLGFVGRLDFQKNPEFLLKVFPQVNERCDHAMLVLLGEGEMGANLKKKAEQEKIKNILFMGRVDNVHEWLQAFDVLLVPSRFEGLGLVLIEAQASGLMCIASECIPRETAISDKITYLSIGDPLNWADKIMEANILYDRKKGQEQVIHSGYEIKESAERLMTIYKHLLERQ